MSVRALNWAFDQRGVPDGPYVLLLVLGDLADEDGVVRGQSRERLAARIGKSIDTVDRRLKVLAGAETDDEKAARGDRRPPPRWLDVEQRGRPTANGLVPLDNVYRLYVPSRAHSRKSAAEDAAEMRPGGGRKSAAINPAAKVRPLPPGEQPHFCGHDVEEQPQKCGGVAASDAATLRDNSLTREDNNPPSPYPFPRARGSTGKLLGEAGEVVALVNHPKLDPEKDLDLIVPAGKFISSWMRLGLEPADIAWVICVVLEKRDRAKPTADRINTWKFFDSAVRAFATEKAALDANLLEPAHVIRPDAFRPRNASEQQQFNSEARRSSWARVLGERDAPEQRAAEGPQRVAGMDGSRGGG